MFTFSSRLCLPLVMLSYSRVGHGNKEPDTIAIWPSASPEPDTTMVLFPKLLTQITQNVSVGKAGVNLFWDISKILLNLALARYKSCGESKKVRAKLFYFPRARAMFLFSIAIRSEGVITLQFLQIQQMHWPPTEVTYPEDDRQREERHSRELRVKRIEGFKCVFNFCKTVYFSKLFHLNGQSHLSLSKELKENDSKWH